MKYGGEKIKVVTDGLKKGDNIQALTFDSCGYLLIGKWNNQYGTIGDPLMSDEVPCGSEANCPNCQPKITDVKDLPGWPGTCPNGDAILAIGTNGKLKTICRSEWIDSDKKVAISSGDEEPGYLRDKLLVCDSDGPISLVENTAGSFQTMCIGWDPKKAGLAFKDLTDTPDTYPNPGLLVTNGSGVTVVEPDSCSDSRYSYVVYDKQSNAFDTICGYNNSFASWRFDGGSCDVPMDDEGIRIYATNHNDDSAGRIFNGSGHLSCTDDILEGTGSTLFLLTRPGVYVLTCNSTLRNITEAGLQAARGGLLINAGGNEIEWTDFKYDSRRYTDYVNDFWPQTPEAGYDGSERNLELSIMSFNTTHTISFPTASVDNPIGIGFWVRCSTFLNDHRMVGQTALDHITIELTGGQTSIGPKTQITCLRICDEPATYKSRF